MVLQPGACFELTLEVCVQFSTEATWNKCWTLDAGSTEKAIEVGGGKAVAVERVEGVEGYFAPALPSGTTLDPMSRPSCDFETGKPTNRQKGRSQLHQHSRQ